MYDWLGKVVVVAVVVVVVLLLLLLLFLFVNPIMPVIYFIFHLLFNLDRHYFLTNPKQRKTFLAWLSTITCITEIDLHCSGHATTTTTTTAVNIALKTFSFKITSSLAPNYPSTFFQSFLPAFNLTSLVLHCMSHYQPGVHRKCCF